jgi:hypothetical protein
MTCAQAIYSQVRSPVPHPVSSPGARRARAASADRRRNANPHSESATARPPTPKTTTLRGSVRLMAAVGAVRRAPRPIATSGCTISPQRATLSALDAYHGSFGWIPSWCASDPAAVRVVTPSLPRMRETWCSAVLSLM